MSSEIFTTSYIKYVHQIYIIIWDIIVPLQYHDIKMCQAEHSNNMAVITLIDTVHNEKTVQMTRIIAILYVVLFVNTWDMFVKHCRLKYKIQLNILTLQIEKCYQISQ